jgi:hypothetical protein
MTAAATGGFGSRLCFGTLMGRSKTGQVEDEFHIIFECPFYAPVRERFSMLCKPFGHPAQTWSSIATCHPAGRDLITFMQQTPALVAAFVHCCYLMRCQPDVDPESLFSTHSIAQVIDDAEEFYSAVSSLSENVGDVGQIVEFDEFFECPSPIEPLVGS